MAQVNPILAQATKEEQSTQQQTATPVDIASELSLPDASSSKLKVVEDAITVATERSVANIQASQKAIAQTDQATAIIQKSLGDISAANQVIQLTKDTADMQAQNNTISAFEAQGGVDIQAQLAANLQDSQARLDNLLDTRTDIMNDEHTGIGIVDTIINEFRSVQVEAEIKTTADEVNADSNRIQNAAAATESFARQNALTKKTINEATIEANQKKIAADATLKSTEAELRALNSNAQARAQLANADQRQVQNLLSAYRLEGEAESRAVQKEKLAFNRQQMENQVKQWKDAEKSRTVALESAELRLQNTKTMSPTQIAQAELNLAKAQREMQEQADTEQALVNSVHRAQAALGVAVEDRNVILFGLRSNKAKYDRLLDMGSNEDIVFGQTPAEAREALAIASPSGNIAPTRVTKMLSDVATAMEIKFTTPDATGQIPKRPKNRTEVEAAYNQAAKEYAAAKSGNIAAGDASNPYQAPAFTVLEELPLVSSTALYQKVLKPKQMKETAPQTIVDAAVAGVVGKLISPEEAAAGIEAVFDAAALVNNTQDGGFRRAGLPNQVTYKTTLTRPPSVFEELKVSVAPRRTFEAFGITQPKAEGLFPNALMQVDLMDKAQVTNMIVQLLSASRAGDTMQEDNN